MTAHQRLREPDAARPSSPAVVAALVAIVVTAATLRVPGLTPEFGPEIGGWTGAHYSQIADNSVALGRPVLFANPYPSDAEGVAYATHPPGVPWLVALSRGLLGPTAFASRLPFFALSLLAVVLVFRLVRQERGAAAGLLAAAGLASCPIGAVYGHQVEVVGAMVLVGVLGATSAYVADRRRPSRASFAMWVGWSLLLVASDWPGLLLLCVMALHALFTGAGRRGRDAAWLASWAAGVAAVVAYLVAQLPGGFDYLWMKVQQRTVELKTDGGDTFSYGEAARRWLETQLRGMGPLLLLGVGLFGARCLRRPRAAALGPSLLLAFCVVFYAVGVQAHFQHDFWSQPVAGCYAACAACTAAEVVGRRRLLLALGVAVLLGGAWMTARYRAFSADHHSASPEVRDHQELAGWLAQRVPEEDVVAIFDDTHWPTLYHYAGRRVVVVADDAELEVVLREPRQDIVDWIHVEHSAPPKWALARRGARMFEGATEQHGAWELGRIPAR